MVSLYRVHQTHHARQYSANISSSLGATPNGVIDRFRPLSGVLGLVAVRGVLELERPGKEGEVGDISRVDLGLVGGDMDGAEGRS